MRINRSEDEQVIAAKSNNSIYNYHNDNRFEYDMCNDFSYSDKKFMNELARDRVYGTANIRPVSRNKGIMQERLYQKAIEESSRMKTNGYYNELGDFQNDYVVHDNVPGRLKSKVDEEKVCQINDALAFNIKSEESDMKTAFGSMSQDTQRTPFAGHGFNNTNDRFNTNSFEVNVNERLSVPKLLDMDNSLYGKSPKEDMYSDIMNKVNDDLIKNSMPSDGTKFVQTDKKELRQELGVKQNNIPYKRTEIFAKGSGKDVNSKEELVVRDCKQDKNPTSGKETPGKLSIGGWFISSLFMILPILGFVISAIVSLIVPKDKAFKCFARICLTTHMLVSLAATYLYMSGTVSIEIIKNYLSRF